MTHTPEPASGAGEAFLKGQQLSTVPDILAEFEEKFSQTVLASVVERDGLSSLWLRAENLHAVLEHLRNRTAGRYEMLYDICGIDERNRRHRAGPVKDFTVVYHLLSFALNHDLRIKVPLEGEYPSVPTVSDLWPSANWYERELWDMFGITVSGHPCLRRILMPPWWQGHPLRKDHYARATERDPFTMFPQEQARMDAHLTFVPEDWGLARSQDGSDFMFLNVGPHHPGTHGVLRLVLQLKDELIINVVPDIGFHHRAAEKMGERQSWHTYIPYTDRVDYLAGVVNELPYVLSVEKLAGITVPPRVQTIRVLLTELFRIISHLVWYGTFTLDLGAMSPTFYIFTDRERAFEIIEAITGARMHPGYFRIGGLADDLPTGWEKLVRDFLDYMPRRLAEYDVLAMKSRILKARTVGVGEIDTAAALAWGVTGPNLRATGFGWDWRKKRPYSGYEQFEFDVPIGTRGDSYDRAAVRVEEMRQSLRIIRQCLDNMPAGEHKSRHPMTTPPLKDKTLADIETLITHFLNVSWGPVIPAGEASIMTEGAKGSYSYYLHSDGDTMSYRTHIRTPSFPHMQAIGLLSRGRSIADLIAILGSLDYVLADVDR